MPPSYEEQIAALQTEPDASVLSTRPGGGGMTLTYLEGYYVIQQLNEIFGEAGWSTYIGEITFDDNLVYATVNLDVTFADDSRGIHQDVGSTTVKGKDRENAVKTAVTDALKRAARNLGPAFGNTLYDKDNPLLKGGKGAAKKSSAPKQSSSSGPVRKQSRVARAAKGPASGKASSFDAAPDGAPAPNGENGTYVCEICSEAINDTTKYSAAQYALFSSTQGGQIAHYPCQQEQ